MAKKKIDKDIDQILANENVIEKDICEEMKMSYLSYSIMTIIDRALPDIRDGLKPVQRRILFSMYNLGILPEKSHKKSARIIGDVIGKYHPHGDGAAYGAMTNLVNDFDVRYPLVDGQGNFGSADGDGPAAMRYTEARLYKFAMEMLKDLDCNAVNMKPNFSEDEDEPEVLPGMIPYLLLNGATGIATGYSTEMPPHNLNEIADAIIATVKKPNITIKELLKYIKGPDLPSYGYLINDENILSLYETGNAKLLYRGKASIEVDESGNKQVVITELPPEVKKPKLLEKLYATYIESKEKKVTDLRDESEENKIRIVLELNKTTIPEIIIAELYKNNLTKSKNYILRAIVDQAPVLLNLKQIIDYYLEHRREVIQRKTQYRLIDIQKRLNILNGFKILLPHIREYSEILLTAESVADAKEKIANQFGLNNEQITAVLQMEMQRLIRQNREKIIKDLDQLQKESDDCEDILRNPKRIDILIIEDLKYLKQTYGDDRKTVIIDPEEYEKEHEEIVTSNEPMFVGLTQKNNIKYMPYNLFEEMFMRKSLKQKNEIFVQGLKCNMTNNLILVFEDGNYIKCNFSDLTYYQDFIEKKNLVGILKDTEENFEKEIILVSKKGMIKKIQLDNLKSKKLKMASVMLLEPDDKIISMQLVDISETNVITLVTKNGIIHRFFQRGFSSVSQSAKPVGCINMDAEDHVVTFDITSSDDDDKYKILLFSEHQSGQTSLKTLNINEFIPKNRMAKGSKSISYYKKDIGEAIGIILVSEDYLLINKNGDLLPQKYEDLVITEKASKPEYVDVNPIITKFFIE